MGFISSRSSCYPPPEGRFSRVTHRPAPSPKARSTAQCKVTAAQRHPEPGSNSRCQSLVPVKPAHQPKTRLNLISPIATSAATENANRLTYDNCFTQASFSQKVRECIDHLAHHLQATTHHQMTSKSLRSGRSLLYLNFSSPAYTREKRYWQPISNITKLLVSF